MGIQNIEISSELKNILNKFSMALAESKEFDLGFNVFSLISDSYYKENFHSEIIYALLNPEEKHDEKDLFLNQFIDFVESLGSEIDINNYRIEDVSVANEHVIKDQRRIDILISPKLNSPKKHAIIIENKINNAKDMDNQLIDYYTHCKTRGLEVDAIIYLSIDGTKKPDKNRWKCSAEIKADIDFRLKFISAYDRDEKGESLYHWLAECEKKSRMPNNRFIISQYKQLLKSLRKFIMKIDALEDYYEFMAHNAAKRKEVEILISQHNNLIYYYPEKLKNEIVTDDILNSCYSDINIYEDIALIFYNIFKDDNYYLKATFLNNSTCKIEIMDNQKIYKNYEKISSDDEFMKLFDNSGSNWLFKKSEYDLFQDFEKLVGDIKTILLKTSSLSKNWSS